MADENSEIPTPENTPKKKGRPKGKKDSKPRISSRRARDLAGISPFDKPPEPLPMVPPGSGPKSPETTQKIPGKRGRKPIPDSERKRPLTAEEREARKKERRAIQQRNRELKKSGRDMRAEAAQEPAYDTITKILPQLDASPDWRACSPKERILVYEYFASGFNGAHAYNRTHARDSGVEEAVVAEARCKFILSQTRCMNSLKLLVNMFVAERKISYVPRILAVLEAQAFYDPMDFLDPEGGLRVPLEQLTYLQRVCIEGIETKFFGKDADRSASTVKLVNRSQALDKLIKYVGMLVDTPTITNHITQTGNIQNVQQTALPKDTQARLALIFDQVRAQKAV